MQTRLEMLRKQLERGRVEHAFDLLAPQISPSAQAAFMMSSASWRWCC